MMNEYEERQERIEAFVMGTMSAEEKIAFQAEIAHDASLAEDVRLHMMLKESLGNKDENAFKALVKEVINEERANEKSLEDAPNVIPANHRNFPMWKYLTAAVVIALIGFFAWFIIGLKPSPHQLFVEYFEVYPTYQMNRSEEHLPQLQEAMEYYGMERFEEAADILGSLNVQNRQSQQMIRFYHGIAEMNEGNYTQSVELLSPLAADSESLYHQQARWYLALSYLKQNKIQKTKEILNALSGEPGRFGSSSQALLEEL